MKPRGTCQLCGQEAELQESHIIPAFVFRWLKETSATGALRFSDEPNLRKQDGQKTHMLCAPCEARFCRWETQTANTVFYPFHNEEAHRFEYGPWLLKFSVSVTWRVLSWWAGQADFSSWPVHLRKLLGRAREAWRRFLLDEAPNPRSFEQHVLLISGVHAGDVPPKFNWFMNRAIVPGVYWRGQNCVVYGKMARLHVVGFVEVRERGMWRDSKVHVKGGTLAEQNYTLPGWFVWCLFKGARRLSDSVDEFSDRQWARIEAAYEKNPERAFGSDTLKAIDLDYLLFGPDALGGSQQKGSPDK